MNSSNKKIVVILSGGMDSTTLLYYAIESGFKVVAVTFDYGQRHRKEIDCARNTCRELGIPHRIISVPGLKQIGGSSQTDDSIPVPHGHYEDETMRTTVVPNRNMIFLAHAISVAITEGARSVWYGAHSGDHAIYPDCRPEFVHKMNRVAQICDYHPVSVVAPFLGATKRQIANLGKKLGVPFEKTWTCYEGGEEPCGKCGACTERAEALK